MIIAYAYFLITTVWNELENMKSFVPRCDPQTPNGTTFKESLIIKCSVDKMSSFLAQWIPTISLNDKTSGNDVISCCIWIGSILEWNSSHLFLIILTWILTVSQCCLCSPLGLCKSLMSIQLFQVFYMKGRIKSIELPKALSFCVFSCGKDKRLKTLWHRPWAFAGYCNPFMVSWILFEKFFLFPFSFLGWTNWTLFEAKLAYYHVHMLQNIKMWYNNCSI